MQFEILLELKETSKHAPKNKKPQISRLHPKIIEEREIYKNDKEKRPEVRFHIQLPNGKSIPGLITGDNMKNFQSGSSTELDENGKRFGQSALGQWLLVDVLGLKERKKVTREWLQKKGTDSVRLWRDKDDYSVLLMFF